MNSRKYYSLINVRNIFLDHYKTLIINKENNRLLRKEINTFIIFPILMGLILAFFIGVPSSTIQNIFTITLSIFIGLFLNLIMLLTSTINNTIKEDLDKIIIIKETFVNILFLILTSLFSLGILLIANINFFPSTYIWEISIDKYFDIYYEIKINTIINRSFYFIFYSFFTLIIVTLLMIIKRIHSLFTYELNNID